MFPIGRVSGSGVFFLKQMFIKKKNLFSCTIDFLLHLVNLNDQRGAADCH